MNDIIKSRLLNFGLGENTQKELDMRTLLFVLFYMDTGNTTGFSAYENNFGTLNLTETYGPGFINYVNKKYFCISKGNNQNIPIVSFPNIENFVDFAISKMYPSIGVFSSKRDSDSIAKIFVDLWASVRNSNVWVKMTEQDKSSLKNKSTEGLQVFDSVNPQL
jgi:hypothetical protein